MNKAQVKCEGALIPIDPGGTTNIKVDPKHIDQWVELYYDPSDEHDEKLFITLQQLIDSRLIADGGISKDNAEAVIRKLAYTYCRQEGF
jgi:hypothetical protein